MAEGFVINGTDDMPIGSQQEIGKKIYRLSEDKQFMTMEVALPFVKRYSKAGVIALKESLEAEHTEVLSLINKYLELLEG